MNKEQSAELILKWAKRLYGRETVYDKNIHGFSVGIRWERTLPAIRERYIALATADVEELIENRAKYLFKINRHHINPLATPEHIKGLATSDVEWIFVNRLVMPDENQTLPIANALTNLFYSGGIGNATPVLVKQTLQLLQPQIDEAKKQGKEDEDERLWKVAQEKGWGKIVQCPELKFSCADYCTHDHDCFENSDEQEGFRFVRAQCSDFDPPTTQDNSSKSSNSSNVQPNVQKNESKPAESVNQIVHDRFSDEGV